MMHFEALGLLQEYLIGCEFAQYGSETDSEMKRLSDFGRCDIESIVIEERLAEGAERLFLRCSKILFSAHSLEN